jgi:hypothetical protein
MSIRTGVYRHIRCEDSPVNKPGCIRAKRGEHRSLHVARLQPSSPRPSCGWNARGEVNQAAQANGAKCPLRVPVVSSQSMPKTCMTLRVALASDRRVFTG